MTTAPKYGDSDNRLLFKIVKSVAAMKGGPQPRFLDSNNQLLFKLAKNLSQ